MLAAKRKLMLVICVCFTGASLSMFFGADSDIVRTPVETFNDPRLLKQLHAEVVSVLAKANTGAEPNATSEVPTDNPQSEAPDKILLVERTREFLRNKPEKLKILVTPPPFGNRKFGAIGYTTDPEYNCGNCEIVFDREQISDPLTKAVVFHFAELRPENIPTTDRRADQLYIFWAMETPPNIRFLRGKTLQEYDKVFNLTMTYRRDSDIYSAYGSMADIHRQLKLHESNGIQALLKKKRKLATWFVSNCAGKRMQVVKDLVAAGLDLDKRGACFGKTSPGGEQTVGDFVSAYKFYLAFENSYHCRDYITEKLFANAFLAGAVPVVYGAARGDYDAVAPPHSFIFAEDFTPEKLVEYLKYLDANDTAYAEYFRWRTTPAADMPGYGRAIQMCHVCRVVHGVNVDNLFNPRYNRTHIPLFGHPDRPRVVESVRDWLFGTEDRDCLPRY